MPRCRCETLASRKLLLAGGKIATAPRRRALSIVGPIMFRLRGSSQDCKRRGWADGRPQPLDWMCVARLD